QKYNYIADPHGAVGYLGLEKYLRKNNAQGIFLETAHPVKFLDVVEPVINETIALPKQIKEVIEKQKVSIKISKYDELKQFLLVK
ncbi:Threonine synthase, partial [hydrothermal vent metagenome]